MTRLGGASLGMILALGTSACGRLGLGDPLASSTPQRAATPTYEALPAAPTQSVTSSALPPPPSTTPPGTPQPLDQTVPGTPPVATTTPPKTQVAEAVDKSPTIGRADFVGAWRIASGSDNCQLFVSLTSWSGGYRASTKGCNTPDMQRISAWDLSGKQVSLKSGDGGVVATLSGSGPEKFAGTTTAKQTITLSR